MSRKKTYSSFFPHPNPSPRGRGVFGGEDMKNLSAPQTGASLPSPPGRGTEGEGGKKPNAKATSKSFSCNPLIRILIISLVLTVFSLAPGLQPALHAQGVAQVTVTGVPPTLASPSVAGQVQNYDQGRFTLQFFLSTPDARAREFRFNFQLEREGDLLFDITSEPVVLQQGVHTWQDFEGPPAILFQQTLSDVINQLNAALQDQVSQTGFLAEGVYTLMVEAVPEDPSAFISTVPAAVTFEVIFPEPPVIISPLDDELINPQFPIFSWTPVTGVPPGSTIEYELLMVELWPGQTPYEAIQGARPHVQTVLTNQTVFSYGADQLPLEPGHTYAWQVTASGFMDQIPFRDEGRTEIHTFTVTDQSGGIPGPFTWSYPGQDPFLQFSIPDASVSANSVTIEGRYQGQIGGQGSGATFDGLIVDPLSGAIVGGQVTLDRSVGFEAAVEPQNGALSGFQTKSPSSPLTVSSGVLFQPGMLVVSQEGIRAFGQGSAALHYGQMNLENLRTSFSPDFLMDPGLTGIISGRMDLLLGAAVVAYIDASGLHFEQADEINLITALPERLSIPSEDIAYIRLREGNSAYINVSLTPEGRLAVSPRPGEPVNAVFAALAGGPEIPVNLQDVLIDPNTGEMTAGTITLDDTGPGIETLLTDRGIPLRLSEFRYDPLTGLQLGGDLVLFGQTFAAAQPLLFDVSETGNMKGFVSLENMSVDIPVVPGSDHVVLNVNAITGNLDIALTGPSNPFYELTVESSFRILGQGQTASEAAVMFSYGTGGQFRLLSISPGTAPAAPLDLGGPELQINEITSLDLSHTPAAGFDFTALLDAALRIQPNGNPLIVPMTGVELRNTGFFIPSQNVHEALPEFDVDPITLGPLELQLLAMRLTETNFDWYNWQPGTPTGLDFRFDFEVSFPGFRGTAAGLGYASVTLQGAGLDGRFLSGDLLTYTLPGQGAFVPFTSTAGMNVSRVGGRLFRNGDEQGFDIDMTARLHAPDIFSGSDPSCISPEFTVNLGGPTWFEGRAEGLPLCQTVDLGGLGMTFSGGYIEFSYTNNRQQVVMGGSVDVSSDAGWLTNISGSGTASWSMISGMLTQSNVSLQNFGWSYPAGSGLFQFSVGQARLTQAGLVITDAGTMNFPNSSAPVTYNNLTLQLSNGQITSGDVEFQDGFGLQIGISPTRWSVVDKTELAGDEENTALLVLPPGLRLNQHGLAVTGSHTGHVNALGVAEENLSAEFQNFLFGFDPAGVTNGLVELMKGQERVAIIDRDGLHLDNPVAAMPLPARLPLPGESIAYIELRDSTGAPLVELIDGGTGSAQTLRTLAGITTKLVLASLGQSGAHPEMDLAFELQVNPSTYQITGGTIDADLSGSPLNLTTYGFPLELTRILFSTTGGSAFELTAESRIKLPEGIPGLAVDMGTRLTFSDEGFESIIIDNGRYSLTRQSDASDVAPLASASVSNGALGVNVRGFRLKIDDNNSFKLSGDVVSNILEDTQGEPAPIHFSAQYQDNDNNWLFTLDVSHLPDGKLPLLQAVFQQEPNEPLTLDVSDTNFALMLSGVITLPDLSDTFALTLDSVYIGSDRVEISSSVAVQQSFKLFGDFLTLNADQIGVNYSSTDNIVFFNMDGSMTTKIQEKRSSGSNSPQGDEELISFSDLTIGTDGSFSLGEGQVNILAGRSIQVLPDIFWLTELGIGYKEEEFVLSMGGTVELPVPGRKKGSAAQPGQNQQQQDPVRSDVRLAINTKGEVVEPLSLAFAFDPNAVPKLGNNTVTEFKFGNIATFELTGAALDFDVMNPVNTTLYATAAVHIHSKGSSASSGANKDKNGKTRVIALGNATDIRNNPGIKYNFQTGLEFILDLKASESNPLFTFNAGLFSLGITSIYMPDVKNFEVTIGGVAGMNLSGVSGSFGFKGFAFGTQGVSDWGAPSGSFDLSVMNVVSLGLGSFDYEKAASGEIVELEQTQRVSSPDGTESDSVYTISVREYMLFGGANISLGKNGAFGGKVEKVLYYEGVSGEIYLSIEDANFSMGSAAELTANLEFLTDHTGFMLRVSGVGRVQKIAMAAVGKISTLNDQLSFGIFLAATGANIDLFPIVPNTIIVSGIGGGLFYRPEQEDLQAVVDVLGEMTQGGFRANNPNGLPEADNMLFAAMLYAEAGLVGTPTAGFAVKGNMLITVTDQFANLDMNGILIRQSGTPGTLRAGMYLTFKWPTPQDTGFLIQGGVRVDVKYPMVTGNMTIDMFIVKKEGESGVAWAIIGNANLEVLTLFTMHGELFISNDGLLTNLTVQAGFDAGIVSVSGRMNLAFWYYQTTGDLGIYTEAAVNAEVLDGALKIGLLVKGALIVEGSDDYLVYAQGGIPVDIPKVYTGTIGLWVALRNDDVDGGVGSNDSYERMIANSRNQVDQLRDQITQLQADINSARLASFEISQATIDQAGMKIRTATPGTRRRYADLALAVERDHRLPGRPLPQAYVQLAGDYIASPDQPDNKEEVRLAFDAMQQAIETLDQHAATASQRIQEVEFAYAQQQAQPGGDISSFQNPLSNIDSTGFSINQQMVEQQERVLTSAHQETQERIERYRQSIRTGAENIRLLTSLMESEEGIAPLLPAFKDAYEAFGRYYALAISSHYEALGWAGRINNANQNNFDIIFNDLQYVLKSFVDGMEPEDFNIDVVDPNNLRIARNLAAERYSLIKQLASSDDSLLTQTDLYNQDYETYKQTLEELHWQRTWYEGAEKGQDFWFDVISASILPYGQWHRDQIRQLAPEYQKMVWDRFMNNYRIATSTLGKLYPVKSKMIETQVAMIDEFLKWGGSRLDPEEAERLSAERQQWALMLEPPRITSLTVTPERIDYYNRARIEWEAVHPAGEISESIIRLKSLVFLTLGKEQSVTHYAVQNWPKRSTDNLKIELAVRGPGGTLFLTETDILKLSIAPEGDAGDAIISLPDTPVLPDNAYEPPTAPEIVMPRGEGPNGYWVSNPNRLDFMVNSFDPAGSRLLFEAALGTGGQDDNIRDWAPLPSGVAPDQIVDKYLITIWQQVTGYQLEVNSGQNHRAITLTGLNLQPGTTYTLSVRAVNGYQQNSDTTRLSFRYDNTPPVFASGNSVISEPEVILPTLAEYGGGTPAASERPEVIQPFEELERILSEGRIPLATPVRLDWPEATDEESGIYRYSYLLSYERDPQIAYSRAGGALVSASAQGMYQAIQYKEPWYVHVQAMSYSGTTVWFTDGPFDPILDPSRPFAPQTRIGYYGGDLVLWITSFGYDIESNIAGYQYAAKAVPFAWDPGAGGVVTLRDWPGEGEIQLPAGQYDIPLEGNLAPGYYLDPTGIESANPIYVYTRSVNSQGVIGTARSSGGPNFDVVDITPPLTGEIETEYFEADNRFNPPREERLYLRLMDVVDPGSGIKAYTITVTDNQSSEELFNDTGEFEMLVLRNSSAFLPAGPITLDEDRTLLGRSLRIHYSVTNGAGLTSEVVSILDLTVPPPATPGLRTRVLTLGRPQPTIFMQMGNIDGYEAGISLIEYRVEDNDTNEELLPWTDTGLASETNILLDGPYFFEWYVPGDEFENRPLRIGLRVTTGLGEQATATEVAAY